MVTTADIPAIEEMRAEITVHGVYSEMQAVDVCCVGNERPDLFGPPLTHVGGYQWYVSRHFALRTDVAADDACFYLQIAEMALPHAAKWFPRAGRDWRGKRLAIVFARSADSLDRAMYAESVHWPVDAGGISYECIRRAYAYQFGQGQGYHNRYILLHTLFYLCWYTFYYDREFPHRWFVYGMADLFSWHAYNDSRRQLTLYQPWTVPSEHPTYRDTHAVAAELAQVRISGQMERVLSGPRPGRGGLIVNFLWDHDPDMWRQLWPQILNDQADIDNDVLGAFGNRDRFDGAFREWWRKKLQALRPELHEAPYPVTDNSMVHLYVDAAIRDNSDDEIWVTVTIVGGDCSGELNTVIEEAVGRQQVRSDVRLLADDRRTFDYIFRIASPSAPFQIHAAFVGTDGERAEARLVGNCDVLSLQSLGPFALDQPLDAVELVEQQRFFPERLHSGLNGTRVGWRVLNAVHRTHTGDAVFRLVHHYGQADDAQSVHTTWVHAAADCEARLLVGTSGRAIIFCNGIVVLETTAEHEWSARQLVATLHLSAGANRLIIHCQHGRGLWLLSLTLRDVEGGPLYAVRAETKGQNSQSAAIDRRHAERLDTVMSHIENHFNANITFESMRELIGVSARSLTRLFRVHVQMSPLQYLINIRIQRACELLDGDMPIKAIAYAVGFNDPQYFSRMFSRAAGVSPSNYRKLSPPERPVLSAGPSLRGRRTVPAQRHD